MSCSCNAWSGSTHYTQPEDVRVIDCVGWCRACAAAMFDKRLKGCREAGFELLAEPECDAVGWDVDLEQERD
jgi:hypothetical protein